LAEEQQSLEIDDEEQARANFYALLARLFSAPPDDQLLGGIAASDDGDSSSTSATDEAREEATAAEPLSLDAAWSGLVNAAANADQGAVAEEYDRLFVGSGRSEVSLYVGAYTARSSVDTKLVALRDFLESSGIQRQTEVHEPEDHISMLFEVMRYLIYEQEENLGVQKSFFDAFVWSGGMELCDAILGNAHSNFFVSVAALAKNFLTVEHDAFEM
jgi:TorA maturation chaperone TorD